MITPDRSTSSDELVDEIDEHGSVVGVVTRAEVRRHNLRHRSVAIVVRNSRAEVLIHRRAEHKDVWPGRWDLAAGGVVASGETYEQAAARELSEELGITEAVLTRVGTTPFENDEVRAIAAVFIADWDGPVHFDDGEVVEARWVGPTELRRRVLDDRFVPDSLHYVDHWLLGSSTPGLIETRDAAVVTLWLDRPAARNAMTAAMWNALAERCSALATDAELRMVVIRGTGRHFCAGADIAGLAGDEWSDYRRINEAAEEAVAALPMPTVAAIRGSCVGGGAQIALACDIRLAESTARFGVTPARLGLVYPATATARLVRTVGVSTAKRLLFTGELLDAAEALRVGLVDELHEGEALDQRLAGLGDAIGRSSMLTQRAAKEMVAAAADGVIPAALVDRWDREVAASPDRSEGIAAFGEKRPPTFTWRPATPP